MAIRKNQALEEHGTEGHRRESGPLYFTRSARSDGMGTDQALVEAGG